MFADTDRIPDEAITDTDPELEDAERHFVSAVDQLPAATEDDEKQNNLLKLPFTDTMVDGNFLKCYRHRDMIEHCLTI